MKRLATVITITLLGTAIASNFASAQVSDEVLKSILTPDSVETSLGTLEFFDGVPTDGTVQAVYDNLDRMRGVEVFLNSMPASSLYGLRLGNIEVGADRANKIHIFEALMDLK